MKTISKVIVALAASTALTASAVYAATPPTNGGGTTATGTVAATASATVITPVTITQTNGLSFGTFASAPTGSAGTIDTSGNVTGGVSKITNGTPGSFAIAGQANNNYTITGDANVTLNASIKGNGTLTAALIYPANPRLLDSTGADIVNVTGVLTVPSAQPADTYSGMYNVNVNY